MDAKDREIAELKSQLQKDSRTSSKPPSSDIVKPPKTKDKERRTKRNIGPNLTALTAYLKGRLHGSYRTLKEYFRDVVGSGADENDLFSIPIGELLALRDSLVIRFGTGKTAS